MFGVILEVTNSTFRKCMLLCLSIYIWKVMKLLVFIFEQPSSNVNISHVQTSLSLDDILQRRKWTGYYPVIIVM